MQSSVQPAATPRGTEPARPPVTPGIVIATVLRDERGETGVQTQFSVLRDYLAGIGHPVRVVNPYSLNPAVVYPIFAVRKLLGSLRHRRSMWWYRTWHYRFIRAALKRVFAENSDVVVFAQDPLSARAALETRPGSQPVIRAMHNALSEADEWVSHGAITTSSQQYRTMQHQERATLTRLNGLVFFSQEQRAQLTSIFPEIAQLASTVVPAFVEAPTADNRTPTRDAVTVGTLEHRKNHQFLVKTIRAAKDAGHAFTLTIVGDGPERGALEAQIQRLGLEDEVTLTGRIPAEQIGNVLSDHRIYLHASRQESFGLAIVEALAVGLPVVVGRIGGVADLLHEGADARFWPDLDDPQSAAALLVELLSDEKEVSRLGEAGRTTFAKSFAAGAVAPVLLDYLLTSQPIA